MPPSNSPILPAPVTASRPPAVLEPAFAVLEAAVARGLVPGAVAAVGTAGKTLHRAAYGWAAVRPAPRQLHEDTPFDLASLTKIVVTTTLVLRYVERGRLYLDQPVASVLPAFAAFGKGSVTIRHLLTHTAGLPAWIDLRGASAGLHPAGGALARTLGEPLERPPGTAVVYSDLGFITLGAVLSTVGEAPLDVLARREVLAPLGMATGGFLPDADVRQRCAATEIVPERGGLLAGVVHDDNADALGGVAGHAGLFATCADLERYCRLWLGRGRLDGERHLSPATVEVATRDQTGGDRRRGLGWVLQPNPFWVPADLCSPRAYSHTGFTGTSLLIDPEPGVFAVLLTNRVHPSREPATAAAVREVRARFHNAVWAAVGT